MRERDRTEATHNVAPNINVTPLIDILLVLLIIFMVITPLKPARFKASIPAPPVNDDTIRQSPRTLIIEVSSDLKLKLLLAQETVAEGTVNDAGAVASRLAAEWAERKARSSWRLDAENRPDLMPDDRIERTVFIKAPRSLHYGEVAKVVDAVKGAGASPIGLQTDELPN